MKFEVEAIRIKKIDSKGHEVYSGDDVEKKGVKEIIVYDLKLLSKFYSYGTLSVPEDELGKYYVGDEIDFTINKSSEIKPMSQLRRV